VEVTCENCKTRLHIPDDKIPENQKLSANCPKCRAKIVLNKKPPMQDREREEKPTERSRNHAYEYQDDDSALDLYEEGVKLALLMAHDMDSIEKFQRGLEGLGYRCVTAQNTREGIGKMRFHHFEVLVLSDQFDGIELQQSPVLSYLNRISMSQRRRIFLILEEDGFKTMDNMMAFVMSANMVVNRKDIDKIDVILKKGLGDHEKFYKVFNDTLMEAGKV
jgi:hypothetical protein